MWLHCWHCHKPIAWSVTLTALAHHCPCMQSQLDQSWQQLVFAGAVTSNHVPITIYSCDRDMIRCDCSIQLWCQLSFRDALIHHHVTESIYYMHVPISYCSTKINGNLHKIELAKGWYECIVSAWDGLGWKGYLQEFGMTSIRSIWAPRKYLSTMHAPNVTGAMCYQLLEGRGCLSWHTI